MDGVARRQRRIGTALVIAQFSLIGLCLVPVGPTLPTAPLRPLGLLLLGVAAVTGLAALLGLGSSTRVHPVPAEGAELREGGIYAWVRHPMYSAVLMACAGSALLSGRVLAACATGVLAVVLLAKARFEDGLLAERYGDRHARYRERVPALIPRPGRRRPDRAGS